MASAAGERTLGSFPGENPHAHSVRLYFEQLHDLVASLGLTAAVANEVPERAATLVDCPVEETTVPDEVLQSLRNDAVGLFKMKAMASKALRTNTENLLKRAAAKREDDNKLFSVIVDSMRLTAPPQLLVRG